MIITIAPGELTSKKLSDRLVLEFPVEWWGPNPKASPIGITSSQPSDRRFDAVLKGMWLTDDQVIFEAMADPTMRLRGVYSPHSDNGYLALQGGVPGVRYVIVVNDQSFQLHVNLDVPFDPAAFGLKG